MCIELTEDDFSTIHHELGHNFYQRAYKEQPVLSAFGFFAARRFRRFDLAHPLADPRFQLGQRRRGPRSASEPRGRRLGLAADRTAISERAAASRSL